METLPSVSHITDVSLLGETQTIGQRANDAANKTAHTRYQKRRSTNTKRRQKGDLQLFFTYLAEVGYPHDMKPFLDAIKQDQPIHPLWYLWDEITYGLVEGFLEWQLLKGYAIGSIGVRLSTIKAYTKLAYKAEVIPQRERNDILLIQGYTHREGLNVDKEREVKRVGKKKAEPTIISPAHAVLLKRQTRSKDAAMMCLLIDMGLRVGELVALKKSNINLASGTITFYREKVDKDQTHRLTPDCLVALQAYLPTVAGDYVFPGYKGKPMTTSGVNKRVGILGNGISIEALSPHDGRHHLLTEEAKKGTDAKTLQSIGGWTSPVQALKYVTDSEIANEGTSFFRQNKG